jgi:hypothetical protein
MTFEGTIITLERLELLNLMAEAVRIGILQSKSFDSTNTKYISQSKAWTIYGRRNVTFWHKSKLIQRIQDGPGRRYRYDLYELEKVASTSNRVAYFTSKNKTL